MKKNQSIEKQSFINYYELDLRVTINNFKEEAILAEYDKEFIQELFQDEFNRYPLTRGFENVKTQPDYHRLYEYVSGLWIHKDLYYYVAEITDRFKIPILPGTICVSLLILAWLDRHVKKLVDEIKRPRTPEEEFSRFVHWLYSYRNSDHKTDQKLILQRGKGDVEFHFPGHIFQRLLWVLDQFEEKDFLNYIYFRFSLPRVDNPLENNSESTEKIESPDNLMALFRKRCLIVIYYLLYNTDCRRSDKDFLCNQLLGKLHILDYSLIKDNNDLPKTRPARIKIVDKIKAQRRHCLQFMR